MKLTILLSFLLCTSLLAQGWTFDGYFPDTTSFSSLNGLHGIAVDPLSRVWIQPYSANVDSIWNGSEWISTGAVYVFNPDGTRAPFSPIKVYYGPGFVDSLVGNTGRGLKKHRDGDILASHFDFVQKVDFKTGLSKGVVRNIVGAQAVAAASADNGVIYTANVVGGNPIKMWDFQFALLGNAVDSSVGFSRSFEVSADGDTIYWAGYTNHATLRYTRSDGFSPFVVTDTVFKGFDTESYVWHPNGLLYASSGSTNDPPNRYLGATTYWTSRTWYGWDPATNEIRDSITWRPYFYGEDSRPRGIAFTPSGDTVYLISFGFSSNPYPPAQRWVRQTPAPATPTLLSPSNGATNQSLNPNLSWSTSPGATGYQYQVSANSSFNPIITGGVTGTTSSTVGSGLSNGTLYYWRVRAFNSSDTSLFSASWTFTTQQISAPATPTLLSPSNGATNQSLNPNLSWSTSPGATGYQYQVSANSSFNPIIAEGGTGTTSSTVSSGLSNGTLYYWRVNASNTGGTSGWSETFSFTTENATIAYPQQIAVSLYYAMPTSHSGISESNYRMIGLPSAGTVPVTSIITTGTQKTDWNVYADNGVISTNKSDYLIEHTNANPLSFSVGRGLWLLSKNNLAYARLLTSVTIDENNCAKIPLQSNWNIITNPFIRQVVWQDVITANSLTLSTSLYTFKGTWNSSASKLIPYEGYYFYNAHGLQQLKIPYDPNGTLGKEGLSSLNQSMVDKYISLSLRQGSETKAEIIAAIDSSSSEDFDSWDVFAPPTSFEEVSIIIKNQNLRTEYKSLFTDSRPMRGDGQVFDLYLKNSTGEVLEFQVSGIEKFNDYEVYLFDSRLKKYYNLKEGNRIISPPHVGEGRYSLLIGQTSFVELEKEKNTVKEYMLAQNYPNPFNPATVIMFSVKVPSNVMLTVYDITGGTVAKLVDGYLPAGYHETEFNAENLSSGIYFYRLEVKEGNNVVYASSKKMVVAK